MKKEIKLGGAKIPSVTIDNYKDYYVASGDSGGSGCETFVEQVAKKEIKDLKAELQQEHTTREELQKQFEKDQKQIADLKSQLANIKYLNAGEVEHIIGSINTNQEKVQAICNLAIPDIDRDKINQELLDQLYRFEGVMGKYECQHGGMECNFQTAFHRLIRAEIDEIIKAIRGEE